MAEAWWARWRGDRAEVVERAASLDAAIKWALGMPAQMGPNGPTTYWAIRPVGGAWISEYTALEGSWLEEHGLQAVLGEGPGNRVRVVSVEPR